jgi:hypothetical protein
MDNAYRVELHFGARGWLTALWMVWRRRNGCRRIPCDCEWCSSFQAALRADDEREECLRRHGGRHG